jgi:hypothetical protein
MCKFISELVRGRHHNTKPLSIATVHAHGFNYNVVI